MFSSFLTPLKRLRVAFSFLWGSEHRLKGGLKKGLNGGPKGGLQGGLKGGLEAGLQGMNLIFFVFNHPQSVFVWLSPACGVGEHVFVHVFTAASRGL